MEQSKLIYTSTACDHCDSAEIDKILETARKVNLEKGITGVLYFSSNYFMQYLEGDTGSVEEIYSRIAQDDRHTNIRLVDTASIEERKFADWAMAYIPQSDVLVPIHMKFMDSTEFNPEAITADNATDIVWELYAQLPSAHYEGSSGG